MKALLLPALALFLCNCAWADSKADLQQLQRSLAVTDQRSGQFTQSRSVPFLVNPLVSRGTFVIDANAGVTWSVLRPVRSTMVISEDAVLLDGIAVDRAGNGAMIGAIMLRILQGDFAALDSHFDIETSQAATDWSIMLRPTQAPINSVIEEIKLHGSDALELIYIVETNGSASEILLTQPSSQVGKQSSDQ